MKKRILAVILTAAMLLTGCADVNLGEYYDALQAAVGSGEYVKFEDMQYERPQLAAVQQALDAAVEASRTEDTDKILEAVYAFYDEYDWYFTCYSLADIHYCRDLTDLYWEEEYAYCVENSAQVDAALEELNYALADSPKREELEDEFFGQGFFDSYDGENLWDEAFTALMTQEAQLENRYYELLEQAPEYGYDPEAYYDAWADDAAQLLAELVKVRKEIAAFWGYDNYAEYAGDVSYYRDYSVAEMQAYLKEIRTQLVPLYRELDGSDVWDAYYGYCTEAQTFDYVRKAAGNMGGTVEEAFDLMERAGLYDIEYGENKYGSSFEVYLTYYWEPFVFMNPGLIEYDKLTLAHEFGHFCCDYVSYGSYAGVDVLEVFSQGMEYLSLCYGEDTESLTKVKMADSLCTYVEQAAFASFELALYELPEEKLTAEDIYALYEETVLGYGFGGSNFDRREFVDISHFFTEPLYIISYVVSNDAAMQLYQLEQERAGAGLDRFEENLDTEESYFLAFVQAAGLESPFAAGRLEKVRATFEEVLQ